MRRITKMFLSCVIALPLAAPFAARIGPTQVDRGEEWLSWSPTERSAFVRGYLTGYSTGTHAACNLTDDLFGAGKPHRPDEQPSARCEARLETYSKYGSGGGGQEPNVTSYTDVITSFYEEHPQYRTIPFVYLMSFLSDHHFKTTEDLYQMALRGQMRTSF
jgi:hypothetical protein